MNCYVKKLLVMPLLLSVLIVFPAGAKDFPDWTFQDIPSAFTMKKGGLDLSGSFLLVNDTVDFLDIREEKTDESDLLAASIGDYSGFRGIVNYGLTDRVMLHYSYQYGEMDTSLGSSGTFTDLDSSDTLDTSSHKLGFRFNMVAENSKLPAFSLEASYGINDSDDSKIMFSGITSNSFIPPGNHDITLSDLSDDGFNVRLLASKTFSVFTPTVWIGYGEFRSDSKMTLNINSDVMRGKFDQEFDITEKAFDAGLGLGIQYFDRCPIFLSYRYITVDRDIDTTGGLSSLLPSRYTDTDKMDEETENHIFSTKIVYWASPRLNLFLDGQVYTNHFLGVVPHYNNTLTNRFFENMYGYIGIGLGYTF